MNFFKTLSAAAIFGSVSAVGAWAQDDTDAANKDYDTLCEAGLAADANALEYLQCFHAVSLTTWHAIMDLEANHRLEPALTNEETLGNEDCQRVYTLADVLEARIYSQLHIKNDENLDANLAQESAAELFVPLPDLLYHAGKCAQGVIGRVEDRSPNADIQEQIDILQRVADFGATFPKPR